MIHLLKSFSRNFNRRPATNLINLFGLAVSLALVIILSVYSYSELTTDNYHKNGQRVYLLTRTGNNAYLPGTLKDQIDLHVPDIESAVRVAEVWEQPVFQTIDGEPIGSDMLTVDEDFFSLFTYETVEGNLKTALKEPLTIVLDQKLARRFFGKEPALGKTIRINNSKELTVSAVVKKPQGNSCLSFNAVVSIATREIIQPNAEELANWDWCNFRLFVLLREGSRPEDAVTKTISLCPKNNYTTFSNLKFIRLSELYFTSIIAFGNDYMHFGDRKRVMILLLVGTLVLLIALVNFINISSAQWIQKIKQTGVLKVLGAGRAKIIQSIVFEAAVLFLLALFLALLITGVISPYIPDYTGIPFDPALLDKPAFFLISILAIIILSLLFSILPALRISSSKAVDNLKKTVAHRTSGSVFQGIMVTLQFVIAIVLIAFTILVQKQVNYGSNNIGFNKENIIGIKLNPQLSNKTEVLKNLIREKAGIEKISFSEYFPGKSMSHWSVTQGTAEKKQYDFDTFTADASFFDITRLQIVQGRFYSNDLNTDKKKMVVNETFVRQHKLDNPVGLKLVMGMENDAGFSEIIGVVKDFHYKSFNQPIGSLIIQNAEKAPYCLISLSTNDFQSLHQLLGDIRKTFKNLSPSFPVEISFFDKAVEDLYKSELQFRQAFSLFAGCAVIISCMGILALSLFACQRRVKEIGIRKVNGARAAQVLALLNKDFAEWVIIAFVFATPIIGFTGRKWLESFAYKTALSWWIYALSGILSLAVALLTVSWLTWRTAKMNPVKALRYE
jgi:putative ABC transport system permease protein